MKANSSGSGMVLALLGAALLLAASPDAPAHALAGEARAGVPRAGSPAPVTQEGYWETRETQIDINGQPFNLVLRYFPGDVAWADRVQSITPQAIPALQQAIGVPYPGPPILRVTERTGPEMYGAAGIAQCNESMCALAIGEASHDTVLLHEIAHVWTYAFKNRWLAEGTAEFTAISAANAMGIPFRYRWERGGRLPVYPLDLWGSFSGFDDEETYQLEYEGYDRSTRLLQIIHDRNPGAMAAAYAALVGRAQMSVESEQFMDALEDAGGGNNDDLFGAWVFPPEMGAILAQRRAARDSFGGVANRLATQTPELGQDGLTAARQLIGEWKFAEANAELARANGGIDAYLQIRDRLAAFKAAAEAAGLAYPIPFDQAKTSLDFAPITGMLDKGDQAIAAYPAARDVVGARRSTLQKLGLLGQDPDSQLENAASAFAWARFDESIQKGQQAQDTINGAEDAGYRNAVIAAVLSFVFVIAGIFAVRWALSANPDPVPIED